MIRFGSPESLWLLWLVPLLIGFLWYAAARRQKLLARFGSPALTARMLRGEAGWRTRFKAMLLVLAVLALTIALAEPKLGFDWEEVQRRGVDVVIALDLSDSMLVQDGAAGDVLTRLERAKREIKDLLDMMRGDRVGLVAFAGAAFVECPLTLDYTAVQQFLDELDPSVFSAKGTAVGEAIRAGTRALDKSPGEARALLLITDGEDTTGEALAAAAEAKEKGVHIYAIGIGRDEGAPVPAADGGFRRDGRGEIILSKLDESTLKQVALATGGAYVRSVTGDLDLETLYVRGIKASLVAQELTSKRRQRWHDRFQWFVGFALLALMVEALVPERGRRLGAAA
jgi:Ca-activated chloride channel homolog